MPQRTRTELTRTGYHLAIFTILYNIVEGVLSVVAGGSADLTELIGFGADSFIESLVAILVAIRLHARLAAATSETTATDADLATQRRREFLTLRTVAISFIILAAYLVIEGVLGLIRHEQPEHSLLGVIVLIASLIVMPLLWAAKRRIGRALGDQLILSDAAETWICLLMTASALISLALYRATGWGGFDAVASFVIAIIALAEAKEAWEGELEGADPDDEDDD